MSQLYRHINILSIDVAVGAIISCAFFSKLLQVTLLPYGYITLGLTVWVIYTTDHLIDVWRRDTSASTERHRYHQKHSKALITAVILCISLIVIQFFFIRQQVFIGGLILSAIVLIYFVVQKKLRYLKELFGAVLYTSGVLMAPVSLLDHSLTTLQAGTIVQFFMTALFNLILFSWFGIQSDRQDQHPSLARALGEQNTLRILIILFLLQLALTALQIGFYRQIKVSLILLIMNTVLLVIMSRKDYFEKKDRYRIYGDAVFFLPILILI